ncbi:gamma-glutamyltransferase [Mesonia sp.]|uniref:gamma-glutamyltransferase n=1 Tax=Mesonia sp. TaxID=1960830 RepID=UPI003F9BACAB
MKKIFLLISFLLCSTPLVFGQYTDYNLVKEVQVKNKGVVVSAFPLASEVGAKILRQGGNAFDASIATQYALAVVYPQAGNIGGGGFMVAATKEGEKFTIDFRETAPLKSHKDMYLDAEGNANTDLSQYGSLAAGVPGAVAGLFEMHQYAKLPMVQLIQPAIDLAEKGYAITKAQADLFNTYKDDFLRLNKHSIPFVKNLAWQADDILVQQDLAHTLKQIQQKGLKGFYRGKTANLIVKEMKRGNGIISLADLKQYKVKVRAALIFDYKGHEVVTMPLPSSGGILLAQMLQMTNLMGLEDKQLNSPEAVQPMVEAERRAYADRAEYMGDPDFIKDQTQKLISKSYLKQRFANYNPDKATPSSAVGDIIIPQKEKKETTHISVLDKEGNAVSVTTTLNGNFGSKVMVSGAGFLLNNEMDDFSVKAGVPNMYGAIGGKANAIAPKKRMLSSMAPTILLKGNKPFMVVGTPGGTTIPTSVFQTIVDIIDFGTDVNTAVNAPKFHQQWLPEHILVEEDFPHYTIQALEKKGYTFKKTAKIGRTEVILVDKNGKSHAVADGRGDDSVGVE